MSSPFPAAEVVPARRLPWAWLPPLLALALVAFAGWTSWRERGTSITISFQHGHGIKPGDTLRHRGIRAGEVETVQLDDDLLGIRVGVRLDSRSVGLARAGSRFWVVRPQIGFSGVVGLDTVVGARYLATQPGPEGAPSATEFVGLDEPPVLDTIEPGSLEVVLEARRRGGLSAGAPVAYRGIRVGRVVGVALESDGTSVEVRVSIDPPYATLVRENTRFWDTGGLLVDVGLSGVRVEVESLESFVTGGIALATPNDAGALVERGHRFTLFERPEEHWLEWRPPLPLGQSALPGADDLPRPLPVLLSWEKGRLLRSDESRVGWVLPVERGVLGPADLLVPPERAAEGSAELRIRGEPVGLPEEIERRANGLALAELAFDTPRWPAERVRRLLEAEDCLVVADPVSAPLALSAVRLAPGGGYWEVAPAVALDATHHGACVVARRDGALVGLLLVEKDGARLAAPL